MYRINQLLNDDSAKGTIYERYLLWLDTQST
jgi:hypothetical protein